MSTPPKLRVLQLIENMNLGGAQGIVYSLAIQLRNQGHVPVVLAWGMDGDLLDKLRLQSITVYCLGIQRAGIKNLPAFIRDLWRTIHGITKIIRSENIDIVNTHLQDSNFLAPLIRIITGKKVVTTIHNVKLNPVHSSRFSLRGALRSVSIRFSILGSDATIAVGKAVAEKAREYSFPQPEKVIAIPNGIAPIDLDTNARNRIRTEFNVEAKDFLFVHGARLVSQKCQADMITAIKILQERNIYAKCLIAGEGDTKEQLKKQIEELGLQQQVFLAGYRQDMQAILNAGDGFVLVSEYEGIPLAMLEAMSIGLPVIGSEVPGISEVFEHGTHGLKVPVHQPEQLANAMAQIMQDQVAARAIAENGRLRFLEAYHEERMYQKVEQLYARLVGNSSKVIGILSTRYPPAYLGGAELQAAALAHRLSAKIPVQIWTRDGQNAQVKQAWESETLSFVGRKQLPSPFRFPTDIITTLFQIWRHRKQVQAFLAYQAYIDGYIAYLAKKLFRIPYAVWIRGNGEIDAKRFILSRLLSPKVFRNADRVLVQSERMKQDTLCFLRRHCNETILEDHIRVIPNGVEMYNQTYADRKGLLFVGRLVPRKGVEDILAVMRENPDLNLTIVGDGPDRKRLEQLSEGLNVTFAGKQPHSAIRTYMERSRVLIVSARYGEGNPNAILEGFSAGIAIIATDHAGIPDLVRHGQNGLLYAPGSIPELAECLQSISGDNELYQRIRNGACESAQLYSWPVVTQKVIHELKVLQTRREYQDENSNRK